MDKIVNLLEFEEVYEGVKEEIIKESEEKGNVWDKIVQKPYNYTLLNKRALS